MKKQVTEFSVECEADHEQYWQGHSTLFTRYIECATGCGSTLREALGDALDGLAQQDIEITAEQEQAITAELKSQLAKGYTLDDDIVSIYCPMQGEHGDDDDPDCAVCAGEWYFYVSIDVITAESK